MANFINLICLMLLVLVGNGEGLRILLLPLDHHPHVNFFASAGKHLLDAGHDVLVLGMESRKHLLEKIGVNYVLHQGIKVKGLFDGSGKHERNVFQGKLGKIKTLIDISIAALEQCEEVLESEKLKSTLENFKFDISLVDGFYIVRCLYIFPLRLGIPYITLTAYHDPWSARVPGLPSTEGLHGLFYLTPDSSVIDRLMNTLGFIGIYAVTSWANDDTMISRHAPNQPSTTFTDLYQQSEMFLVNMETMCLDFPRVSAPHYQFVAGMGNSPAKPLPEEFATFMNSAIDGVIVVSFGSTIKSLPLDFIDKLMDGFRQIPQKVVMRFKGTISGSLPSNVKIAEWLPQNDLLGHNKTRLFITHAGNNGQSEALYHGVPMLGIPLFGDQAYNAIRVTGSGLGLHLDPHSFTSEELVNRIRELVNNPVYLNKMKTCSNIIKEFPSAEKTIKFWVEHVSQFGSSHLKSSYVMSMPLWKFFMLDIVLLSLLILLCLAFCCYKCCCFCGRKLCKKPSKQKSE